MYTLLDTYADTISETIFKDALFSPDILKPPVDIVRAVFHQNITIHFIDCLQLAGLGPILESGYYTPGVRMSCFGG
jgi:hypothetical protein